MFPILFFLGVHQVSDASKTDLACISINRLEKRKSPFVEPKAGWIMDSGAFTTVSKLGEYPFSPAEYAARAARWVSPKLLVVVAQDYMCEPFILKKTGLTVEEHQRRTVERYDALCVAWEAERIARGATDWPPIMPVLQGWTVEDYLRHMDMYGDRLTPGMWVGVGSVCKRQGDPAAIEKILLAIATKRPDLRLHGFGVKYSALQSPTVRVLLFSADSMAWSFAARYEGRNANDINEGLAWANKIEALAA